MSRIKRKIIRYNPLLKELARKLRNNSTKSEIILWKHLKGKQMKGFDFHRQKPIDKFILDFFCHELMLGIELDGSSHDDPDVQIKDKIKEHRLKELGITILRFEDVEVFDHVHQVVASIEDYIADYTKTHP